MHQMTREGRIFVYLGKIEAQRFYPIWLGLLEFANQKHNIAPELKKIKNAKILNPGQLLPITN